MEIVNSAPLKTKNWHYTIIYLFSEWMRPRLVHEARSSSTERVNSLEHVSTSCFPRHHIHPSYHPLHHLDGFSERGVVGVGWGCVFQDGFEEKRIFDQTTSRWVQQSPQIKFATEGRTETAFEKVFEGGVVFWGRVVNILCPYPLPAVVLINPQTSHPPQ